MRTARDGDPVIAVRVALVGLVVLLLQVCMVSQISVAGARGNLVLLFAIAAALETDARRGAICGFALGLAFDLLLNTPAGLSALTMALVGYTVGSAKDLVLRSSRLVNLALVAVASAGGTLLYASIAVVLGVTVDPAELPAIVAVVAVVNVLLSTPLRWALRWAFGPERQTRRRDELVFR